MSHAKHCIFVTIPPGQNPHDPKNRFTASITEWKALIAKLSAEIVMFDTDDDSVLFARQIGIRYTRPVTMTWDGLARLDSMTEVAHTWTVSHNGTVSIFVNADIRPTHSVIGVFKDLFDRLPKFLATKPIATTRYGPFENNATHRTSSWFAVAPRTDLYHHDQTMRLHDLGGYDFWAWDVRQPLFRSSTPPFRYGRPMYDNWLLDALITRGDRHVIDLSGCMNIYHSVHTRIFGNSGSWYNSLRSGEHNAYLNRYMAFQHGYRLSVGTWCETPWVCSEMKLKRRFLRSNVECSPRTGHFFECDVDISSRKCLEAVEYRTRVASMKVPSIPDGRFKRKRMGSVYASAQKKWPYTLREQVARRKSLDDILLLSVFNKRYTSFAMNFKCTMDRFNVKTYTMGALDRNAYEFGVKYGLPVFDGYNLISKNVNTSAADYGSTNFRQLTKTKSYIVLQILRMGVSVIFCDVDIGWASSPWLSLVGYVSRTRTLTIQSNAPMVQLEDGVTYATTSNGANVTDEPPLGKRRLNSGLYIAPTSPNMIRAFKRITTRAIRFKLSEQPAFYDELCTRVSNDECHDEDVTVRLLDRRAFRHEAVFVNDTSSQVAYHPNWRVGGDAKRNALRTRSMWHADSSNLCTGRHRSY